MSTHLTAGQRAALEADLLLRLQALDRRLASELDGGTRAEHAREVLQQDGDDGPQRAADREVDLALTDQQTAQQGEIAAALRRLRAGPAGSDGGQADAYGRCADCGTDIPFDRLRVEPWARRCVPCESAREGAAAAGGAAHRL